MIGFYTKLMKYFSTPEKPVSDLEFVRFWNSLTSTERFYYRRAMMNEKD